MARTTGLTKKEKSFCEYYVFDCLSATQAYIKAYGVEYESANKHAWEKFRKPQIKEYIETLQKQAFEAACITAEKVALKLAEIAFSEKGDEDYTATAQLKALDLLQKQMGLQTQKVEADISTDIHISIEE